MAVRTLRRAPTLAVAAIAVLSLGIGANAAIFTLVRAVLLRPLPGIAAPAALVNVHGTDAEGELFGGFSHLDYRERGAAVAELAAFTDRGMTFGSREQATLVPAQLVSGNGLWGSWIALVQEVGACVSAALSFISSWPRRIEHQSLCSAIGMPHSTQIRVRAFGVSVSRPSKRLSSDMPPPGRVRRSTHDQYVRRRGWVQGCSKK
jgi:hypothetical protein